MSTEHKSSQLDSTCINEYGTNEAVPYLYSGESGLPCIVGKQKYQMFVQSVSAVYRSNTISKLLADKGKRENMTFLSDVDITPKVFTSLWNFINGASAYYAHNWMTPSELLELDVYVKYFNIKELEGKLYHDMYTSVWSDKLEDPSNKKFVLDNKEQLLNFAAESETNHLLHQINELTK